MNLLQDMKDKVNEGHITVARIAADTGRHTGTVRRWLLYAKSNGDKGQTPSYEDTCVLWVLIYGEQPATWTWEILKEQDMHAQSLEYARIYNKYIEKSES